MAMLVSSHGAEIVVYSKVLALLCSLKRSNEIPAGALSGGVWLGSGARGVYCAPLGGKCTLIVPYPSWSR